MTTPDTLSPSQLRRLVCENIRHLSQKDRQDVLNYVIQEVPSKKLITAADGTRISLDSSIPDEVILGIHNLIQSRMIFFDPADFKQ